MISTAGGILVCSACGHESPSGNRFCGMCGAPLPHPPLTTPGAQGTIHLTRGPLEHSPQDERQTTNVDQLHGAEDPQRNSVDNDGHPSPSQADDMTPTGETPERLPDASAF